MPVVICGAVHDDSETETLVLIVPAKCAITRSQVKMERVRLTTNYGSTYPIKSAPYSEAADHAALTAMIASLS